MCIRPRPPPAPGWGKWYPEQPGEGVLGGCMVLRGGTPILPPWVTPCARCPVGLALEKPLWAGRCEWVPRCRGKVSSAIAVPGLGAHGAMLPPPLLLLLVPLFLLDHLGSSQEPTASFLGGGRVTVGLAPIWAPLPSPPAPHLVLLSRPSPVPYAVPTAAIWGGAAVPPGDTGLPLAWRLPLLPSPASPPRPHGGGTRDRRAVAEGTTSARPWSHTAGRREVPAARQRPTAAPPCQLAPVPAWHPLPARSCLHTLPPGPSPPPRRAQHPPAPCPEPRQCQGAQPDPAPRFSGRRGLAPQVYGFCRYSNDGFIARSQGN